MGLWVLINGIWYYGSRSEPVDEIDHVVEPATGAGADAASGDGNGHMGLPQYCCSSICTRSEPPRACCLRQGQSWQAVTEHSGIGTLNHLTGELFKSRTDTLDIVQVPYRGAGPVIADLMSGQIPIGAVGIGTQVIELHRAGKLRVLAVASPTRLVSAPDLATAAEAGLTNFIVAGSMGLLAPANTPTAIVEQIARATRMALADHAYQKMLFDGGFEPTADPTPEKFRQSLAADIALWTPVIKALGLHSD